MAGHWKGVSFVVGVPSTPDEFWRAVRSNPPSADDFLPDSDVRNRFPTEDHCSYRSFTAWSSAELATQQAQDRNALLVPSGEEPLTHVACFKAWPKGRHAIAEIGPHDGHWGVWGTPEDFVRPSRLVEIHAI